MYIVIGDPHITIKNIEESKTFFNHIIEKIDSLAPKPVDIIILGDGQHNHSIIRLEVLVLWDKIFNDLSAIDNVANVYYLVGNHDLSGDKNKEREYSSFSVFRGKHPRVHIINEPRIYNNMAFIPYTSDEETFIKNSQELYDKGATETLICHQTFNGAKYETGMYAPEGFEHTKIPQTQILSGHIHIKQEFDKVFYPGTWRWMTKSDANTEKGYLTFEADDKGTISNREMVSTENICTPIKEYLIEEGDKLPKFNSSHKNYITLKGSAKWANKIKQDIKDKAIIKIMSTDSKVKRIDISTIKNIEDFINNHHSLEKDITKDELKTYIGKL
ncbi:MAG TPA: metallophosphoesterase [Methanosarcinales archaeon]|nr:metallophosphoesterase [Methanosarcinales archaeon]